MGPGGQRPCPSIQLRHSCCLGELRHMIARSRQVAFTPKPSSGSYSQIHPPARDPSRPYQPQTPRSHISPLYSPAYPLQSNITSCWLCLLNRPHIHTTVPHPMAQCLSIFHLETCLLCSSPPICPQQAILPKYMANCVIPLLNIRWLPTASESRSPTLLNLSLQLQSPEHRSWLCTLAKQLLQLGMPFKLVFA